MGNSTLTYKKILGDDALAEGIDTQQEKNIFGYRGEVSRPIPRADRPLEVDLQITDAILQERADTLIGAAETDNLIDDLLEQLLDQLKDLYIDISADPELLLAVQRLGGDDAITFGIYNRALNILRNATIASMCVDPVHLIFATSNENGTQIPKLPTKVLTCEEAANPALFDYTQEEADAAGDISLHDAQGMQKQMRRWRTILLVWYGVGILQLKIFLQVLDTIIRKLRFGSFLLSPLRKIFEKIRDWTRSLVCSFEKKIYGRELSNFCTGNRRPSGVDDDESPPPPEGTTHCWTNKDITGDVDEEYVRVDKEHIKDIQKMDIENWDQADCMAEEYGDTIPESEGCPNFIPQECIESAQAIVDRVHDWALDQDATVSGDTNPQAIMIYPIVSQIVDLQETGKFMITAQDNSELSDTLNETTNERGFARARWKAPVVVEFINGVKVSRIEYSDFSSNRNATPEDDCE